MNKIAIYIKIRIIKFSSFRFSEWIAQRAPEQPGAGENSREAYTRPSGISRQLEEARVKVNRSVELPIHSNKHCNARFGSSRLATRPLVTLNGLNMKWKC